MTGTRDRILDASAELFARQGYHGTGVKALAGHADAQLASLYHFFPGGKQELAAVSIVRAGAFYQDLVTEVIDAEPDIVTGLEAMFAGAAATLEATDYADACPIETIALEVASTDEVLRQATADVFASWIDAASERLVAGGLTPAAARSLAIAAICALEGAFVLSRAARTTEALEAAGAATVAALRASLDAME